MTPFSVLLAPVRWPPVSHILVTVVRSEWLGLDPGTADLEPVNPEE